MSLAAAPKGARNEKGYEMYAVIKTGGKQYRVAANDKILIEKLAGAAGDHVNFTEVLMVSDGGTVDIGAPFIAGATVVGEIEKQARGPHIIIFKKRRRKHYRRRNGHRQDLTSVVITEILTGGAKPKPKAKAKIEAKPEAVVEAAPVAATAAPVATAAAEAKPKKAAAKPRKPKTTDTEKE
jgi:large subunit ribosomal protein L21